MDRPGGSAATVLRARLGLAEPALHAAARRLWQAPGLGERYPRYLRVMHGVIRASVPLMRLAARRCTELGPRDPVAAPLRRYLDRHIVEEHEHDEWLLADLAALGHDPGRARAEQPSPAVARLVGAQYYWTQHHHPVALLGYIAVLESNAPAASLAGWLVSAAGVPTAGVRTVRAHAALDTAHASAVFDLLDTLALTPAQRTAVAISGLHTCDALLGVFAAIMSTPRGTEIAR
jgi:pyrroloquinoline quinone (PQQ) biosynthesis protein C